MKMQNKWNKTMMLMMKNMKKTFVNKYLKKNY